MALFYLIRHGEAAYDQVVENVFEVWQKEPKMMPDALGEIKYKFNETLNFVYDYDSKYVILKDRI